MIGTGFFIINSLLGIAVLVVGIILIIRLFKAMDHIEQIKNSVQQMEKKVMMTVQKASPAKKAAPAKRAVTSTKAKK